ncbi:MAG TPA: hypothetical protein PKW35_14190 [Nannocystaceae bacterium]|nr:hypothetical protein [Nannocystaceae bacterium]
MGRPRNLEHVRVIAARVVEGDTYQAIGDDLGLSPQVVAKRIKTIREIVTETTGKSWLKARPVAVCRAFLELVDQGAIGLDAP